MSATGTLENSLSEVLPLTGAASDGPEVAAAITQVRCAVADLERAIAAATSCHDRALSLESDTPPCDRAAVAGLRAVERVISMMEARRYQLLVAAAGSEPERLSHRTPTERHVQVGDIRAVELAALTNMTPTRARNMCYAARSVLAHLPQVLAVLDHGIIGGYHASLAIAGWQHIEQRHRNAGIPLPERTAVRYQTRILRRAAFRTVAEFKRTIAASVASLSPRAANVLHATALHDRSVSLDEAADGMAYVRAYLAAADAAKVWQALEYTARTDTALIGTQPQRMADALVALCVGTSDVPAQARTTAAELQVLVSYQSLCAGLPVGQIAGSDLLLEGDALVSLLSDSKFRRLVYNADTGQLMDFGRTTYRPPTALRDYVTHRDRTCRAPGCTSWARYADIDHTVPWQDGGTTEASNLAALCRTHHVLKTHGEWRYRTRRDGTTEWQLPSGAWAARPVADYSDLGPPEDDDPPF